MVSSVVEHCLHTAGVTGSNPVPPTIESTTYKEFGGLSSAVLHTYCKVGLRLLSNVTDWYPATIHPVRSGFYELGSGDRLYYDSRSRSRTWGTWFAEKPGIRFVLELDPAWRWRGLAAP